MDSRKSSKTYYGFIMVKKLNGTICGRFPLTKKECTFGRDDKCDIKILLENVSAHHCSIFYIDDKAYIRDKSLSGSTKVNGKKIGRNNFLLHHSDEIEICNRKFVWEYANSYVEFNNLSNKRSGIKVDHTSPRLPERSLNQINTPQDNKILSLTPAKSNTKNSSKILLSINKTPIIVASSSMSKHSFDELKNNLQKLNSSTKCQSDQKLSKSYSLVPGRNIPLIGDSKSTQRKSWVVTNASDNLSSSGAHILNKLSTERLKRDSTPEFNSSYHYQDENVEFDSPEPVSPSAISTDDRSVQNIDSLAESNLSVDQSKSTIHQEDNDLKSFSIKTNILPNLESEPNTSRRETYSIDAGSIVFEQNSTPTPRRSILKCSKTTKPNRSRSNGRMVQFARLPNTDSKIKMSRSRFNTVPNFVVTNDEFNETDVSQDSRKVTQFNVEEEYDDDLDGVQPLDISVSSLINSPILDISSIHKSSKRGSRGNKVMSLINSFENRTHDSPKQSIRASDILSMNGSISGDTTLNDSQKNSNVLLDSVSSTRRINLEDVFIAEDSLQNASCILENKKMMHDINKSSEQHAEITSNSEINLLNNTDVINMSDEVSDLSSDVSRSENEFNFASPLKIQSEIDPNKTTATYHNESTFVNTEKDNNLSEIINNQSKTNISQPNLSHNIIENCIQIVDKSLMDSNNSVKNTPPLALNNSSDHNNMNDIQNNSSINISQTSNDGSDSIKNSNNISALMKKNELEDLNQKQNSISELSKNSINIEKNHSNAQSNISKLGEKSSNDETDDLDAQKDVSKLIEEESPSMIIQCMSKMLNSSVDELETTHSQHKENPDESYVIVDKCKLQNASNENLNKSLMDAIEVQLDKMHDDINISFDKNELVSINSSQDTNIEKTLTSSTVSERTEIENPNLEFNDNSSKNSMGVLLANESTTNTINPGLKTKLSVKNKSSKSCSSIIQNSDISQLTDNESGKDLNTSKNCDSKSNSIKANDTSFDLSKTVPSDDSFNIIKEKSKLTNESLSNISNRTRNSRNLNKSKINLSTNVIENKKTRSSQKIVDEFSAHIDQMEDSRKINKSIEGTLDASIGKPRYESTPWNGSKTSKTSNSTASNQANETLDGNVSIIADKQNKTTQSNSSITMQLDELTNDDIENIVEQRNRSRSTTPDIKPEVWSQMMKDFNESVKKASGTDYINDINNSIKIPINQELKSSKITIKVTTEKGVSLNYTDSENTSQEAKNENTIQGSRISSCSSNNTLKTSVENDRDRPSLRNSTRSKSQTEIPKRSLGAKSLQSKSIKLKNNSNSEDIIDSVLSNKKNSNNFEITTSANKRSGTANLDNISSDSSNENSQETKKSLPITNCVKNNKKTTSKPNTAISTPESKHESNTDSSLNKSLSVTRNKKMTKKKQSSLELPPTRRNLRVKVEKNDSGDLDKKLNRVDVTITDGTSSCDDTGMGSSGSANVLPMPKRQLRKREQNLSSEQLKPIRVKVEKNESDNSNKKLNRVDVTITDGTSSGNDDTESGSSGSANVLPITKRQLRKKEQSLCIELLKPVLKDNKKISSSNKPLKNTSNSENDSGKILSKNSKEVQPKRTRFTRSNSTLNDTSLPKLNKKTKSSSPIKTKSVKVGKIKKTASSKSSKKSQPKSLPSKPIIKTNKRNSSEYESLSETEEIPQETQLVDLQPKTKRENTKKNVQIKNNSSSLSARRNQREEKETLNVSSQLSTRSRKRVADSSPFCQPIAKGPKRDISSKIANTINSCVSNSPNECESSGTVKLTRNKSKLVVSQSSNNSFPQTAKIGKKEKCTTKSVSKKRVLDSDESSMDHAPSTKKITKKATAKENETEIIKSNASTRSKSKVPSTDTDDSKNSTKNVKKVVSSKPMKKKSTKQTVSKSTKSPPPRVLRSKRK